MKNLFKIFVFCCMAHASVQAENVAQALANKIHNLDKYTYPILVAKVQTAINIYEDTLNSAYDSIINILSTNQRLIRVPDIVKNLCINYSSSLGGFNLPVDLLHSAFFYHFINAYGSNPRTPQDFEDNLENCKIVATLYTIEPMVCKILMDDQPNKLIDDLVNCKNVVCNDSLNSVERKEAFNKFKNLLEVWAKENSGSIDKGPWLAKAFAPSSHKLIFRFISC